MTCKRGVALQLDDDLAVEVAPGSGGVQGLQTQLLRMQNAKTAQDNEEAVEEALMETVVHLAQCDVPFSMVKEMGQQEYQARLHTAQAKVNFSLIPLLVTSALSYQGLAAPGCARHVLKLFWNGSEEILQGSTPAAVLRLGAIVS